MTLSLTAVPRERYQRVWWPRQLLRAPLLCRDSAISINIDSSQPGHCSLSAVWFGLVGLVGLVFLARIKLCLLFRPFLSMSPLMMNVFQTAAELCGGGGACAGPAG